jgi:hypothetical protein
MRYSIAVVPILTSTLQALLAVNVELKPRIDALSTRLLNLIGEFFGARSHAGQRPGIRAATAE